MELKCIQTLIWQMWNGLAEPINQSINQSTRLHNRAKGNHGGDLVICDLIFTFYSHVETTWTAVKIASFLIDFFITFFFFFKLLISFVEQPLPLICSCANATRSTAEFFSLLIVQNSC